MPRCVHVYAGFMLDYINGRLLADLSRNVEAELQRHQDRKLGGQQVPAIQPEYRLRFLFRKLKIQDRLK